MPSQRSLDTRSQVSWVARFRRQWQQSRRQVLRFLAVGVLNTGFSFSIYSALLYAGLHFTLANLISLLLGVVFSFRTQGAFVFENRDWQLFRTFALVWTVIYVINVALIALLVSFGLSSYLAGAAALPPTVVLSFLLQRHFVFRQQAV